MYLVKCLSPDKGPGRYTKLLPCHPTDALGGRGRGRGVHQIPCPRTERGTRICLPVHCLSAWSDRQPYCHTNATFLLVEGRPNCARQSPCQYTVGTSRRYDIVLRSRSPLLCLNVPYKGQGPQFSRLSSKFCQRKRRHSAWN